MAPANSMLPVSMDHIRWEMDWVPTSMLTIQSARLPRGLLPMALINDF